MTWSSAVYPQSSTQTYQVLADAQSWAERCQAWVEQRILGHTGVYLNPVAATASPDFTATSDPYSIPAGVAVIFGPAPSNGGVGHTGFSLGGGLIESVWSDGSLVKESISTFQQDNAAKLLGWQNFGKGAPSAADQAAAATVGAAGVTSDATQGGALGTIIAAAKAAGFTGIGLINAIAVAIAESGGDPTQSHTNTDGSIDRGAWQINNKYWASVSDAQAYDPFAAAKAAYTISKGGTDFSPWTTWKTGAAQGKLTDAASLLNGQGVTPGHDAVSAQAMGELPAIADFTLPGGQHITIANPLSPFVAAGRNIIGGAERVLFVVLGLVILIVGIWLLVRGEEGQVTQDATGS